MKKNKKNAIFLIIPLFLWLIVFALPVRAEKVCCELRGKNDEYCDASLNYQLAEKDCSNINKPGCVNTISVTDMKNCKSLTPVKAENKPSPNLKFIPQVSIPDSGITSGKAIEIPASAAPLADYTIAIFKYSIGIIGIIAAVVLMYGGVRWMTAGGNSNTVSEAKKYIVGSLGGLTLTLAAFLLLSTINLNLVTLKIPDVRYISYEALGDSLSKEDFEKQVKYNGPPTIPDPDPFPVKSSGLESTIIALDNYKENNIIKNIFSIYPALASASPIERVDPFFQCAPEVKRQDYSWKCTCDEPGKITKNESCEPENNNLSTMCTSGCGLVSSYMILHAYGAAGSFSEELEKMAKYMETNDYRACHSGTNGEGIESYFVNVKKFKSLFLGRNMEEASVYLKKGYPILAGVSGGKWTKAGGGHYIVLHWQEGDRISVKDPINTHQLNSDTYNPARDYIDLSTEGSSYITKMYLFYKGNLPSDCSNAGESCGSNGDCCDDHKCYWTANKWVCSASTHIKRNDWGCDWRYDDCYPGDKCLFNGGACRFNGNNMESQKCYKCNAPNACINKDDWGCNKNSDCCTGQCYKSGSNKHECY